MSRSRWAAALSVMYLLIAVWVSTFAGEAGQSPPSPALSLPTWATVQEQTIPTGDSQAIKHKVQEFSDLLKAGNLDAALALMTPAAAGQWRTWWGMTRRQLVGIEPIGEPQFVSPDWAMVSADLSWKQLETVPDQGAMGGDRQEFYFRPLDPKHLIDGGTSGEATYAVQGELAAAPVALFWPWWTEPGRAGDPRMAPFLAITPALFSRRWSGWDADREKLWENIHKWWDTQRDRFGPYLLDRGRFPRFVGMSGDSAVVEMTWIIGAPPRDRSKVTYRYRAVQDPTIADPPGIKGHLKWHIADICVWKVENVPLEPAATPATRDPGSSAPDAPAPADAH